MSWWRTTNNSRDWESHFLQLRHAMVETQLARRDIRDQRVLAAMRAVPRHLFIPEEFRSEAYQDSPVAIGWGQTISQPYIVASMTEHLELTPQHRVLEIGTGSGYQTAVLASLARAVYSIELNPQLMERARQILHELPFQNTTLRLGDGALGWPEEAPFDRIIVTAAAPFTPPALIEQLADPGRMLLPRLTSDGRSQELVIIEKSAGCRREWSLYEVRFVPLLTPRNPHPGRSV